jgi:DNA-binding PadR family transcriptional regulator
MGRTSELARGEWVVLALLDEKQAHGWLLSRLLAPDGEIGQIWSGDRQRVYRAIRKLNQEGLIEAVLTEPGDGAYRTVYRPTEAGRAALKRWLSEPVTQMRDVQNTFVLKLVFNQRAGRDTQPLLTAQRNIVAAAIEAIAAKLKADPGAVHLRLRLETTRALLAFMDGLSNQKAVATQPPVRLARQRPQRAQRRRPAAAGPVSDFSGRPLDDDHDAATIILRFSDATGGIVVASAHVDDPIVGEITAVAREASPRHAVGAP